MTTNDDFIQRRKHVRVDVEIPVVINWAKLVDPETAITVNLSGGGLRCLTNNTHVQINDSLQISFNLPGYIDTQVFSAKVVFAQPVNNDPSKAVIGIQFQYVAPKIEQAIIQFCFQTEILNRRNKSSWDF